MAERALELETGLAEGLSEAAKSTGRSVEDFALDVLHDALNEDWAEDEARFAEYERTGISYPADKALEESRLRLEKRLAEKAR